MKKAAFLIILAIAAIACTKDDSKDNPLKTIEMTDTFTTLSAGNAEFAFNLFRTINDQTGANKKPIVISPLSAAISFGMMANGAANETLDELLEALGADKDGLSDLNDFYHSLISEFPGLDKKSTVKLANSIWTNPSFTVYPAFSNALTTYYNAETYTLNFDTAVSDINSWCSKNTNGLINDICDEDDVDPDTEMLLFNALYFKGEWAEKFDKKNTSDDKFTNYDGSTSTVSYMNKSGLEAYGYEADDYCVLNLYFGNRAYTMQIMLPNEGVSLMDCIDALDADEWAKWWNKREMKEFEVKLPKFSVEDGENLSTPLRQMGLGHVVDNADFSNISEQNPFGGDIMQETVFKIDEDGATAASVTKRGYESAPGYESGKFYVTRPFLYLVKECSSDTILFIGRITNL